MDRTGARRARIAALLGATVGIVSVAVASAAVAKAPGRPALQVTAGSVTLVKGRLTGSVTAFNSGTEPTRRFLLSMIVASPGQSRLARRVHERGLPPSGARTATLSASLPAGLPNGRHAVWVCARRSGALSPLSAAGGCRRMGAFRVSPGGKPFPIGNPPGSPGSPPGSPGSPPGNPGKPTSSVPTNPIPFQKDMPFRLSDPQSDYWVFVPDSYDASHQTPTTLFVWLHGCGGESSGDIYTVSPGGSQDWISLAVGGREDQCWDPDSDQQTVLAAISDIETHFNIDPHRVILGGYSPASVASSSGNSSPRAAPCSSSSARSGSNALRASVVGSNGRRRRCCSRLAQTERGFGQGGPASDLS